MFKNKPISLLYFLRILRVTEMISILFCFLDFLCNALYNQWLVYLLVGHLIVKIFESERFFNPKTLLLPLFLLLVQDTFWHGRFGLALLWIIPALGLARLARRYLLWSVHTVIPLVVSGIIFIDQWLIKGLICSQPCILSVTICKIFATLGVGYLVFLGMWGSRFFVRHVRTERGKSGLLIG